MKLGIQNTDDKSQDKSNDEFRKEKIEDKPQDKSNNEFRKVPTTKYLFWVFHSLAD